MDYDDYCGKWENYLLVFYCGYKWCNNKVNDLLEGRIKN